MLLSANTKVCALLSDGSFQCWTDPFSNFMFTVFLVLDTGVLPALVPMAASPIVAANIAIDRDRERAATRGWHSIFAGF